MCEEVECESYHDLPPACHCAFASCNVNCQVEDSFIEYVQEALCNTGHWEWVEILSIKSVLFSRIFTKPIPVKDENKDQKFDNGTTIGCSECPSFDDCDNCGSDSYVIGVQVAYFIWLMYLFIALGMTADAFFVPILVSQANKS